MRFAFLAALALPFCAPALHAADADISKPHWSFTAPQRPPVPKVGDAARVKNPIDAFIIARLEKEGLKLAPEADKAALLRRASYDLTGLPPAPGEVDGFIADASYNAYEKMVYGMLRSPRFGEKMATHWLDLARYADTAGDRAEPGRDIWRWRDWVIEAFNRNLPYDQFVTWQLAGDLLPGATTEQKLATAFFRNSAINLDRGANAEEYVAQCVAERVKTFGTAFLGLTVQCARCHDHKSDPLKQREYYGLYAYFNAAPERGADGGKGGAESVIEVPNPAQQLQLDALRKKIADAGATLGEEGKDLDARQAVWEAVVAGQKPAQWEVLAPGGAKSLGGAAMKIQPDGSVLATGHNPANDHYELVGNTRRTGITAIRLDALTDPSLAGHGPGRAANGNFVLSGIEIEATSLLDRKKVEKVRLVSAGADYSQQGYDVGNALRTDPRGGWAVDGGVKHEARVAWFVAEKPFGFEGGTEVFVQLDFVSGNANHAIGRPRISLTTSPAQSISPLPPSIVESVAVPAEKRDAGQADALKKYYRENIAGVKDGPTIGVEKLRSDFKELLKTVPTVMVMQQMEKPRETHVLGRGQYNQPGEKVEPGTPAMLPPPPAGAASDRLALARWLTDPQHPLTARVAVNRLWKDLMGTGLVKTAGDFGVQGESPSHPELLDWLATEFIASKWDVKHIVELIVTSAAYRQSAGAAPEMAERDPENRLYARGPHLRLGAAEIRDTALSVSGLLNLKMGGQGVSPESAKAGAGVPAELCRRSVYTMWKRNWSPRVTDAPDRKTCTGMGERTGTPQRTFTLTNDATYRQATRVLAERMMTQGGATSEDRIRFGFRIALARIPAEREMAVLTDLFEKQKARYTAHADEAVALLASGEARRNEKLDAAELAAWMDVVNAIFALDESVARD